MIQQRLSRSITSFVRQQQQCMRIRRTPLAPSPLSRTLQSSTSVSIAGRRWYSQAPEVEAKKAEEDSADSSGAKTQSVPEASKEDASKKELEAKEREVIDLKDRVLRSAADYRNLQEQTKREVQAARDFALQRFSKDLLDSIDNLDRALETVPKEALTKDNQDLLNLHSGLKMTETVLMQTLKKHGLERFDPAVDGDKFDPNKHEALFQAPMAGKEDGTVFHTQSKGFMLNGRVLRAAKVGVAKNS